MIDGIFTHLCVADSDSDECRSFTNEQLDKFDVLAIKIADMNLPHIHQGVRYSIITPSPATAKHPLMSMESSLSRAFCSNPIISSLSRMESVSA